MLLDQEKVLSPKMKQVNWFNLFFFVVFCVNPTIFAAPVETTPPAIELRQSDLVKSIFDFLDSNEKNIRYSNEKDIALILGPNNSGKTTIASLLTDADIDVITEDNGEFIFIDKDSRISKSSTDRSNIGIPELLIDENTQTVYYDCPPLNSTNVQFDIEATYLIGKLFKFANTIKLLFTVDYLWVKNGTVNQRDFIEFTQHISNLIRDIQKYRNGIALVVTKVENKLAEDSLIEDNAIIESIASVLEQTKHDLESQINDSSAIINKEQNAKQIQFIELLLEKTNDKYEKIGIVRQPNSVGSIKNMTLLQDEKNAINTMINGKLQYVTKDDSDFGYVMSEQSKVIIPDLIAEIQNRLSDDITAIDIEIKEFLAQMEKESTDPLGNMIIF